MKLMFRFTDFVNINFNEYIDVNQFILSWINEVRIVLLNAISSDSCRWIRLLMI